jgi:hypothetical protein
LKTFFDAESYKMNINNLVKQSEKLTYVGGGRPSIPFDRNLAENVLKTMRVLDIDYKLFNEITGISKSCIFRFISGGKVSGNTLEWANKCLSYYCTNFIKTTKLEALEKQRKFLLKNRSSLYHTRGNWCLNERGKAVKKALIEHINQNRECVLASEKLTKNLRNRLKNDIDRVSTRTLSMVIKTVGV